MAHGGLSCALSLPRIEGREPVAPDHDGRPDEGVKQPGLNAQAARDGAQDLDAEGYPNLEEFLNGTNPRQFVDYAQP